MQAQHPDLTLTGLYNVLEKLRAAEGSRSGGFQPPSSSHRASGKSPASDADDETRAVENRPSLGLTAKERDIHDRGLVSILKQLHDDLDAAVFAAYGWATTLTDAEILDRLVTLNAQRAEEEKRGIIHWLRPEYQNAKGGEQEELGLKVKKTVKGSVKGEKLKVKGPKTAKTAWPKPLAERIRATEQVLHAAGTPVTAADLTKAFSRAKPADLQEILESLVTLGRAHQVGEKFSV